METKILQQIAFGLAAVATGLNEIAEGLLEQVTIDEGLDLHEDFLAENKEELDDEFDCGCNCAICQDDDDDDDLGWLDEDDVEEVEDEEEFEDEDEL